MASALGLISTAPNYHALWGFLLVAGAGMGCAAVSMSGLVSRLYPERSAFALNLLHAFFSVGAFVGPTLAGLLISTYGSWRLPYLITSIAFAPLITVAAISARKMKYDMGRGACHVAEIHGRHATLLEILIRERVLILAGFFYVCAEFGTNAWLPSFLVFEKGFSIVSASLCLGLFWASMAVGRVALGSLADRLGYKKLILSCSLLGGLSISAGAVLEETYVVMALWAFSGFAFGPIMPTIFAWSIKLFPSRRGFALGSITSMGFLGAVFSSWFLGAMAELYTLRGSALFIAFSAFAVGLSALLLRAGRVRVDSGQS
jgi:fucose permease